MPGTAALPGAVAQRFKFPRNGSPPGDIDEIPMTSAPPSPPLLITTLAEYQTAFWLPVGQFLRERGVDVHFLSFDDRSHERLTAAGLPSVNAFDAARAAGSAATAASFEEWTHRLGVADPNLWMSHERVAFGLRDGGELRRKFCAAAAAAEAALGPLCAGGRFPVVVQELGGFLSVVGTFFAARARGLDHYFIEPSFFKGRFLFLKNTYAAKKLSANPTVDLHPEVRRVLEKTRASQSLVIPVKDKHHYAAPERKIFNARNVKRLLQKWWDQRSGKRQEFGYLGAHVAGHLRMVVNGWRLKGSYTSLESLGRFLYYPLHVPGDVALTLRAPEYFDQLALIDYMARTAPASHRVAFKEHPAMIGALDAGRIRALLRRHDNVALLPPQTNNYEVLKAADAVITVNSKSGAEALLLGKPVFVLGDAFYRFAPSVRRVDHLSQLPGALRAFVQSPGTAPDARAVERFFQEVWDATWPGELYQPTPDAAQRFADSLRQALSTNDRTAVIPA